MEENLKKKLEILKFALYGDIGAMRGTIEDIEFTAVQHPFNKVFVLTASHKDNRTAGQMEQTISFNATVAEIAKVMTEFFEYFHPDMDKDKRKNN